MSYAKNQVHKESSIYEMKYANFKIAINKYTKAKYLRILEYKMNK